MSQDYSRIIFDPGQDYLGVLLQQGRPLMDADWNALVAQLNRRTQAGSYDTFGPAVVPQTTPDGFLITPVPGGFTIGRGRIYVDGILAENHGAGARTWDAHLAEEFQPDPVAWNAQPHGHTPVIPAGFPYLVYVDVWQREVGPLEDPREDGADGTPGRLVDVAVGVDTTARLQTIWQVRVLDGLAAGTDCGTPLEDIPGWAAATAPSAGRLTTATGTVTDEPDPCLVPPLGGYKGAENQLYRVEVHTPGPLGTATFKWSRDNASIQARVRTITGLTSIVVDSIGKDEVLRFNGGDWLEITNEQRELAGEPGVLRRIAVVGGVNDSTRTITLAAPLAAGDFPVNGDDEPVGTRTRIRKWNQAGIVKRADGTTYTDLSAGGSTGEILIPADGTQLLIENGILVSFGVAMAGGLFRSGDWWVFAARTNDASVEILDAAPPRGIHHHYAKLAVVTSATEADDCREIWPPDRGCCTVVVRPGDSIQDAIDSLPPTGGCVCLKSGVHEIDQPLTIAASNIILHGEAPGTRVVGRGVNALLIINGAGILENIEIAMISFELPEFIADYPVLLLIQDTRRVHVRDCALRFTNEGFPQSYGIWCWDCAQLRVTGCLFEREYWGVYVDGASTDCTLADNGFVGALYTAPAGQFPLSGFGVYVAEGAAADVHGNRFDDFNTAVLAAQSQVTIEGNEIRRRALPAGFDDPAGPEALLYAIFLAGTQAARVSGNRIELDSRAYGGVRTTGLRDEIAHNQFISSSQTPSLAGPVGVFAGPFSGGPNGEGDQASVTNNEFNGLQIATWGRTPRALHIAGNCVAGVERAGGAFLLEDCADAVVADNTLRDLGLALALSGGSGNRILDNTASALRFGALLVDETALDFEGNRFDDLTHLGVAAMNLGVSARLHDNRIAHCGYLVARDSLAISLALLQTQAFVTTDVSIQDTEIASTGVSPDGTVMTDAVAYGVAAALASHLQIADNRILYPLTTDFPANREHRALWLVGMPCYRFDFGSGSIEIAFGAACITGNIFQGPAQTRLVDVQRIVLTNQLDLRFEKLTFSDNRCDHTSAAADGILTVDVYGSHMIINGNHVKSPPGGSSIDVGGRPRVVLLGNYTTRPISGINTTVPAVHTDFNAIA